MIIIFAKGDGKEYVVNTFITVAYNGGGSVSHELIAIDTPPYEHIF
jgi:hypothetical protein